MKRILVRIALGVVVLTIVAAVAAYTAVSRSLPQLDGSIVTTGLSADVTIERDALGVPVITASNRTDLAYATGYVHGQDRFFQMDLTRRNAAGELAELFGRAALSLDRQRRLHRFRERANTVVANLPAEQKKILQAYAKGVNDGVSGLRARPFEYFLIRMEPRPWEMADSILVVYSMFLELNDERASRDVRRGLVHGVLPQAVFEFLYPQGTSWDAPLLGEARAGAPVPGPDIYNLAGRRLATIEPAVKPDGEFMLPGSNNWAVAGRLTDTGGAIVANDMHLGLTAPSVFYRARMRTTGNTALDLNGVTLPGAPILVAGSNGRIAWGNTNSYGDWSDAVIVRAGDDPGTYLTPDGPREFMHHQQRILVRGSEAESFEIRETIWGPVLDDDPDPFRTIAVSWIAHYEKAVSLGHLDLESAASVDEALQIGNRIGMPPQNFVVGDADGNIGWTIAGAIPRRSNFDPMLPADWSETVGWDGWIAAEQYPRVINPESARIWTANARVVDDEGLAVIGDGGYDLGARAQQIRDDLFARERFTPDDMLAVQLDDRAVMLSRWRELLLATLDDGAIAGNAQREAYRDLAAEWTPRAAPESVGYRLVRAFRTEVRDRVFIMMMQPVFDVYGDIVQLRISNQFEEPLWLMVNEHPAHLLTINYASWNDLLLQAIDSNIAYFAENYTDGLQNRSWGERNTAAIQNPLSQALPFLSRWLDMPADPLPGDSNMPRAQDPSFGASERFAVTPGSEAGGYLHMPAGQSGHPLSDYYRAGHRDWVDGRPAPFLPGAPVHTLVLDAAN